MDGRKSLLYSPPNHPWSFIQRQIVLDRFIRIVLRSFIYPPTHMCCRVTVVGCVCVCPVLNQPRRCTDNLSAAIVWFMTCFCKATVFEWQPYWRNCRPFSLLLQALERISIHIALDHLVLLLQALPLCLVRRYIAHVCFIITGRWPRPCASVQKVCPQSSFLRWWFSTLVPSSAMNCFRTVCPFHLNGWDVSYNGKGRSGLFCKNGTIIL